MADDGRRLEMSAAWLKAVRPESTPVEWRDTYRPGLVLRVETSGRMTWVWRYRTAGRERRYTLGTFRASAGAAPETGLSAARDLARDAAQKGDPQAEHLADLEAEKRRKLGETVGRALASYKADEKLGPAGKWKGGLEGGTARSFLPHLNALEREFGERLLSELAPQDVEQFLAAPEAAATRNRRLQALRFLFGWAIRKHLVEADPTAGLTKERETERSRVLTDDELRAFVHGFDGSRYAAAVRMLALTGLRRGEVLGARWAWLDGDVLTVPPEAEKAGRDRGEPRRVPLSPAVVQLLKAQRERLMREGLRASPFVFPTGEGGPPHADALKARLYRLKGRMANGQQRTRKDKRATAAVLPADLTIHDVRRTVANALRSRVKADPWIVDWVVLGHARPKLLRIYQPDLPLDEARDALTKWAQLLDEILAARPQEARA